MLAFLFGNGRQSLAPWEYALVEDLYRVAARECSPHGSAPHRFQSAVWYTLAGDASFTDVLAEHAITVSFRIVPQPEVLARW